MNDGHKKGGRRRNGQGVKGGRTVKRKWEERVSEGGEKGIERRQREVEKKGRQQGGVLGRIELAKAWERKSRIKGEIWELGRMEEAKDKKKKR